MKVADFNFFLPEDLVAKRPPEERASSRFLVLHRDGSVEHKKFSDLTLYLDPGDMLIINNTKVFPARLTGFKQTGGKLEILLIKEKKNDVWEIFSKGDFTGTLIISEEMHAELYDGRIAHFTYSGNFMDMIWKYGSMPLPPYIKRLPDESDKESYQTIYAKEEGSIAAPTAGLHFSDRMLKEITTKGVIIRELTLHIGTGTFRPIRSKNVEEHSIDTEYFEIDNGLISEIKKVNDLGKRVFSVGTTTTRAIEGYFSGQWSADLNLSLATCHSSLIRGYTDIFIYPGYEFKAVNALITNFHLPKSTPLMLASALCGWEKLMNAYKEAITRKYRFFSYGDAMLIL